MTRIECVQLAPELGAVRTNVATAAEAIHAAADADVVVLPELVTSGYVFHTADECRAAALPTDGGFLDTWARACSPRTTVIAGFAELGAGGHVYTSAAVLDRDGLIAVYRKIHLWDREKLWFTPGSAPPPLVARSWGLLSTVICYDLEFPELTRPLALAGTQLLAVPTTWPLAPRPPGERPPEVQTAMVTARTNRIAIACADRAGTERGQHWTQGTAIIDRDGWVVAEPDAAGRASAELDLDLSRDKRLTGLSDAFADRRPDVYAALAAPDPNADGPRRRTARPAPA